MIQHTLKKQLERPGMVIAPGCHDALGAKIIEQAGFEAVYMTGNGLSASLIGAPDIGLLTLTEMAERGYAFAHSVNIPVIADGDTGYGNVNNVQRTVRAYEAAGVAAVHFEDQVTPKRCGAMAGIALITPEEHAEKIQAAREARSNNNFLIIGRTDARIPNGFEDALARGQAYARAGADLVLLEMLQSEDEIRQAVREIDAPLMFNVVDGRTPPLSVSRFRELGVRLLCFPVSSTLAYACMMRSFAAHLKSQGNTSGFSQLSLEEYETILERQKYQ